MGLAIKGFDCKMSTVKKSRTMTVVGVELRVSSIGREDYICLTDMLKGKDGEFFFSDWLRNRNTVEFLGIWERVHNPDFNYGEFDIIKSQAGENAFTLKNPGLKGNQRDYADINQLICLSNMENLNAVMIEDKVPQPQRLKRLNEIAIHQMKILTTEQSRGGLLAAPEKETTT